MDSLNVDAMLVARGQVLEAMAMGQAIVSTTRGIKGLAQVVLANTAADFARAIVALVRDPARRRTQAVARYDWRHRIPRFEAVCAG